MRNGSIQRFNEVVAKYGPAFKADKNHTLVQRLGHNVLKTGDTTQHDTTYYQVTTYHEYCHSVLKNDRSEQL